MSFTDDYFKNNSINGSSKSNSKSSSSSSSKKKKYDIDTNDFTSSFFKSYSDDELKVNSSSNNSQSSLSKYLDSEEKVNEYNKFIEQMQTTRQEQYDLENRLAEKRKQEAENNVKKQEQIDAMYQNGRDGYEKDKQKVKNNLIYNWNLYDDNGNKYSAVDMIEQDDNGYFKTVDKNGNVYWTDAKNDLLLDANYNEVSDELLKNSEFMNSLEYVYTNNKYNIPTSSLPKFDKSQYQFLVDSDKEKEKSYNEYRQRTKEMFESNLPKTKVPDSSYINNHTKEGWIIKDGKYYKPTSQQLTLPDKKYSSINETTTNIINQNGKMYVEVPDEKPKTFIENQMNTNPVDKEVVIDVYDKEFEKFNKSLEKGDVIAANNALEVINKRYFGHNYNDSLIVTYFGWNNEDTSWFQTKFNDNVDRLSVINNTLSTTEDADLKEELESEKNKLEFENQLIQYNKVLYLAGTNKKIDTIDAPQKLIDEAWSKVGDLWSETFDEFSDGYQFGDLFGTGKNILNNIFQTVGATGEMVNGTFQSIESMLIADMDESEFKDTWMPAIMDVLTYLIPYVGPARFAINYAEPASVLSSFITQEGSATISTEDGSIKTANAWNAGGAAINMAANYFSDFIFKRIRGNLTKKLGEEGVKELESKFFDNSAKRILSSMGLKGFGEASEEFIQTYAEYMQNLNEPMSLSFFTEHFDEALKSAFVAFVVTAGADGTTSAIGEIRNGTSTVNGKGNGEVNNYRVMENVEGTKADTKANTNVKINEDFNSGHENIEYNVSDTDNFNKLNTDSFDNSEVHVDTKENAATNISTELQNGNVVSIVTNKDIDVLPDASKITIGNANIANDTNVVLSPSSEMTTYLTKLNKDLKVYTFDPDSDTFFQDVVDYLNNAGNSNVVFKSVSQFTPTEYKFTPIEMNDINKTVNSYRNKGNLLDTVNNKVPLNTVNSSDIVDNNLTTIMNNIKSKFMDDIDEGRMTKDTAQKEFKQLSKDLSKYAKDSTISRSYIRDTKGNIITFAKTGDNTYEAVNTIPRSSGELAVFANVKTNGNILNGNLNSKANLDKSHMNAVNKMIDKLGLKGNYLTKDSTLKQVAELVKLNKAMSKEILQALGVDGIFEGKNKIRLTTAYDNLDNANFEAAVKKTTNQINNGTIKNEIKKASETTAPKAVTSKLKETTANIKSEPIDKKYNYTPDGDSELVNMDLNKELDEVFNNISFKDKVSKTTIRELKTTIRRALFDRYTHINDIAKPNSDTNVRQAISQLEGVASDSQVMIKNGQLNSNGEVIGKSLDQIFKDNKIKDKKTSQLFDKYMMLELNIERENAGVDKVFDNVSKEKSRKLADAIIKKHPEFKTAADDLRIFNNNLLDMLVDGGVIKSETSAKLKDRYKFYMPIYSSELSTFSNISDSKYIKSMNLDNTLNDVTKTGKQIQSFKKSMESKVYNVLSAIAKNNLATQMADSSVSYEGDGKSDLIYYKDGNITKIKADSNVVGDLSKGALEHTLEQIGKMPVAKQLIDLSNLSYRFILDPIYQVKNLLIDAQESQFIYSKDKKNFAKNYARATYALANNSELYNEFKRVGLADIGSLNVRYDENGNISSVKENKFQRIKNNLENLPKFAEYISLKEKYMKQARQDYDKGLISNTNDITVYRTDLVGGKKINTPSMFGNGKYYGLDTKTQDMYEKMYTHEGAKVNKTSETIDGSKLFNIEIEKNYKNVGADYYYDTKVAQILGNSIVNNNIATQEEVDSILNNKNTKRVEKMNELNKLVENKGYSGLLIKFEGNIEPNATFSADANKNKQMFNDQVFSTYGGNQILIFDGQDVTSKKSNVKSFADIEEEIKTKAMLDAKDINLDFNSGGVVSKSLSKSGFKFLNAGMLGFDKFVNHVGEGVKTPKGAGALCLEFAAVGIGTALANQLLNGDDEDYEKLPYYYKNNYYMIKTGDDKFIRIPKGRVQALYNVLFEYATGIRDEDDAETYIESIKTSLESAILPPELSEAAPWAPWKQILTNENSFGNEIYDKKYDDKLTIAKKSAEHLLSSYFGRYGRIAGDIMDDNYDKILNEFDFYKDTYKQNKHLSTIYNLRDKYNNIEDKTDINTQAEKKYINTQISAINSIYSEIHKGKEAGKTDKDMKELYAARDDLIQSSLNNYKNYETEKDEDGNIWYWFDDHCYVYRKVNHRDGTTTYEFTKKW